MSRLMGVRCSSTSFCCNPAGVKTRFLPRNTILFCVTCSQKPTGNFDHPQAEISRSSPFNTAGTSSASITLSGLSFTTSVDPTPTVVVGTERTCGTSAWSSVTSVLCVSMNVGPEGPANKIQVIPYMTKASLFTFDGIPAFSEFLKTYRFLS